MILDYHHLPICAIMLLFFGAFFITTFGTRGGVRRIVSMIASALSLACLIALIKPVMIDGEIISYWLGNRSIAGGYAIGIAIEVDALSLFFGLLVGIAAFAACVYSLDYVTHDAHQVQYYTLLLMTSGGVLGMVLTGDIFNMYIMVEILTIGAVGLTAYRSKSEGALEAATAMPTMTSHTMTQSTVRGTMVSITMSRRGWMNRAAHITQIMFCCARTTALITGLSM